jgi:hypothetical protein
VVQSLEIRLNIKVNDQKYNIHAPESKADSGEIPAWLNPFFQHLALEVPTDANKGASMRATPSRWDCRGRKSPESSCSNGIGHLTNVQLLGG